MPEPGSVEQPPKFALDYKLKPNEVATEGNNFFKAFTELLDNDPDVHKARLHNDPDSDFPDRPLTFHKGDVLYKMRAVSLKDQNGTEYGQQLYLLRYDNMKNEEVLIVTTGRNPSIDYRSVYADKHLFGKETKADRDYAVDNGLAANGGREMLGRVRTDFAKVPTS